MRFSALLFLACAASTEAFAPSASSAASFRTRSALSMTDSGAEEKEIKVGVIGCGRIGIVHLGAITKAPNVRPVIVSNPTVSKAEKGASVCWFMWLIRRTCNVECCCKLFSPSAFVVE